MPTTYCSTFRHSNPWRQYFTILLHILLNNYIRTSVSHCALSTYMCWAFQYIHGLTLLQWFNLVQNTLNHNAVCYLFPTINLLGAFFTLANVYAIIQKRWDLTLHKVFYWSQIQKTFHHSAALPLVLLDTFEDVWLETIAESLQSSKTTELLDNVTVNWIEVTGHLLCGIMAATWIILRVGIIVWWRNIFKVSSNGFRV